MAASESPYRIARRAFISACQSEGVDIVTRVHPIPGPDGKPVFQDCAPMGARNASKALILICETLKSSAVFASLVPDTLNMRPDIRLVFIHGFDPLAFAGFGSDRSWSLEMLKAIAREDIAKARKLVVLSEGPTKGLVRSIKAVLTEATVGIASLRLGERGSAHSEIEEVLSSL